MRILDDVRLFMEDEEEQEIRARWSALSKDRKVFLFKEDLLAPRAK